MARGTNLEQTREFNRRAVLTALRRLPVASRTDIARRTGLSLSAVSSLVDELVQDGLVRPRGRRPTARGQPPIEYELEAGGAFGVGVALDRDHAAARLVDLAGTTVAERRVTLAAPSVEEAVACVADLSADLLRTLPTGDRGRVAGLGVAVPGVMGADGTVVRMVRLPGWEGADLALAFGSATRLSATVVNDAIAAAVGESAFGPNGGRDTFFYVLFALGLGSALIMHGHPYRGLWGFSGRLGHIPVAGDGPPCPACGGSGCLALYASVEALEERLAAGRGAGPADGGTATGPGHGGDALLRLDPADPTISAWLDQAAWALARGLVVLENLLDPDALVFDGRMPGAVLEELVRRTEERYASARLHRPSARRVELVVGTRGGWAVAHGAASLPLYVATAADLALVR